MKYEHEITIAAPLAEVVRLFNAPEYEKHWRPEPISAEHVSGTPRQPGAKTRMKYRMRNREFHMVETILSKTSQEFSATYEANNMVNTIRHSFSPLATDRTLYKTEVDYTFKSLMPKIMSVVMPGFFKKQTYRYMKTFKDFAESAVKK